MDTLYTITLSVPQGDHSEKITDLLTRVGEECLTVDKFILLYQNAKEGKAPGKPTGKKGKKK